MEPASGGERVGDTGKTINRDGQGEQDKRFPSCPSCPSLLISSGVTDTRSLTLAVLFALGDEFVERVLKEDAFEAVAGVARWSLARERLRFRRVAALGEDAERQSAEECARGVERQVHGVVGEGR